MVIRSVRRLSRILLTYSAQVHFRLLTCSVTSLIFVFSLTQAFIFLSRYVMSFPSLFVWLLACLLGGVCQCFRAVYHCWKYARVVDVSLQAYPNAMLEDLAVLGECSPPDRDSSLNLLVLVFGSGAVSLSQADVAFNVLDPSVVEIYWRVVFYHHLSLRLVHLQTLIFTFIG